VFSLRLALYLIHNHRGITECSWDLPGAQRDCKIERYLSRVHASVLVAGWGVSCGGLLPLGGRGLARANLLDCRSSVFRRNMSMSTNQAPKAKSKTSHVLILAVFIGAILLALFKLAYREVDLSEVMTVIALFSLVIAYILNFAWARWAKRGH
jgi:hypothetical protein